MFIRRMIAAFALAAGLAACASAPVPPPAIGFETARPIHLAAPAIDLRFAPELGDGGAASPAAAGEGRIEDIPRNWAARRLAAGSGGGAVLLTVTAAHLALEPRPKTEGFAGLFAIEEAERLSGRLAARLEFRDRDGSAVVRAEVNAAAGIPEYASPERRARIRAELLSDLAAAFDAEMTRQIRDNFPPRAFSRP